MEEQRSQWKHCYTTDNIVVLQNRNSDWFINKLLKCSEGKIIFRSLTWSINEEYESEQDMSGAQRNNMDFSLETSRATEQRRKITHGWRS